MTKADTLLFLRKKLKKSKIEPIFLFTRSQWKDNQNFVVEEISKKYSPGKIVVRSSATGEDCEKQSGAGKFHSELGVDSFNISEIKEAIQKVIRSYGSDDNGE